MESSSGDWLDSHHRTPATPDNLTRICSRHAGQQLNRYLPGIESTQAQALIAVIGAWAFFVALARQRPTPKKAVLWRFRPLEKQEK
jgi:hypothetical protein